MVVDNVVGRMVVAWTTYRGGLSAWSLAILRPPIMHQYGARSTQSLHIPNGRRRTEYPKYSVLRVMSMPCAYAAIVETESCSYNHKVSRTTLLRVPSISTPRLLTIHIEDLSNITYYQFPKTTVPSVLCLMHAWIPPNPPLLPVALPAVHRDNVARDK